jgi:hypothetical protein
MIRYGNQSNRPNGKGRQHVQKMVMKHLATPANIVKMAKKAAGMK